jgi:ATP-dependent DNA helicase RecG
MRNTYTYSKLYSGEEPIFTEGDVFRIEIPLQKVATQPLARILSLYLTAKHLKAVAHTLASRILTLVKRNPHITQQEIADQLDVSVSTIKREISDLVKTNVLTRKQGKRYGYWEFVYPALA